MSTERQSGSAKVERVFLTTGWILSARFSTGEVVNLTSKTRSGPIEQLDALVSEDRR
jgi:hypothetical protein